MSTHKAFTTVRFIFSSSLFALIVFFSMGGTVVLGQQTGTTSFSSNIDDGSTILQDTLHNDSTFITEAESLPLPLEETHIEQAGPTPRATEEVLRQSDSTLTAPTPTRYVEPVSEKNIEQELGIIDTAPSVEPTANAVSIEPIDLFGDAGASYEAATCERANLGIFICGDRHVGFFEKGAVLTTLDIEESLATYIFQQIAQSRTSCAQKDSTRRISAANGCTVNPGLVYTCQEVPQYELILNKGGGLSIFMRNPFSHSVPAAENESETATATPEEILSTLAPIDTEQLIDRMAVSEECRVAGAMTRLQCEELLNRERLPQECKEQNIMTEEGCRRFLLIQETEILNISGGTTSPTTDLPEKCVRLGITDRQQCATVLTRTELPQICLDAGSISRSECDTYIRSQKLPELCGNDDTCETALIREFIETVECSALTEEVCRNELSSRHVGTWLAMRDKIRERNRVSEALSDTAIASIASLPDESRDVVRESLTNDRPVYVYPSFAGVILTKEDTIDAVPSAVLILDDDGDGLSNELEERIGTNRRAADSDEDGYTDREELQNGFDPLGEGKKEYGLWPIDGAMVYQFPIDQPLVSSAEVVNELTVASVKNDVGEKKLNTITGRGPANSLMTLYVYSGMPIVLTVQTDRSGNWEYTLEDSLADGEHEAYLTLVDSIGVITQKSEPLTFFVKEAQAVEPDEFFGFSDLTVAPESIPVNQFSRYYVYGAVGLVLFALLIAVALIWSSKARRDAVMSMPDESPPHA